MAGNRIVLFGLEVCGAKMEQSLHRVYRASEVPPPPPKEPWCSAQFTTLARRGLRVWVEGGEKHVNGSRHATLACTTKPLQVQSGRPCDLRQAARGLSVYGPWSTRLDPILHVTRIDLP